MITEDYVSFETAKLLKEKGFEPPHDYRKWLPNMYTDNGEIKWGVWSDDWYPRITLQMAMKWLREEKHWYIQVSIQNDGTYIGYIYRTDGFPYVGWDKRRVKETPEEACEAVIKYCLKNLIKNEDKEKESEIPVPKTVDEAISTLEKILSEEDRNYLLENGAISMHNSLGMWIRNEWGLWTGSELKDELMNMNKGLNHPDDMSNYIIEEFIKYWNNKL